VQHLDESSRYSAVRFYTDTPVDKVLQVILNKLHGDHILMQGVLLHVEVVMGSLELCCELGNFRWIIMSSKINVASSLPLVVKIISIEHF
jgi:hypothetical protein